MNLNLKKYVLPLGICLAIVGMSFFGVDCFGADTPPEPEKLGDIHQIIDTTNLKNTFLAFVGPIVAAAIGVGLAVWGARFLFRIVKSMARG